MFRHPVFWLYGLGLLGGAGWLEYGGYSFSRVDQHRVASPKSIRDNPGIYRSIYGGYYRYSGGK